LTKCRLSIIPTLWPSALILPHKWLKNHARFPKSMKSQSLFSKAFVVIFRLRSLIMPGCMLSLFIAPISARAAEMRALRGHVPSPSALTQPLGRLPGTNSLRLAISLPLRNREGLAGLLQRLYDPASPDYHHYLTPAQFNEKFGPTGQDYQKVIRFAASSGLEVVATRDSRMLLDIRGKASDVEKAFHVTLRTYQHPSEARQFYAPDVEPTVDADLPILDIVGLGDYAVPRPLLHLKPENVKPVSASGSQTNGYYLGSDFRNAYAPGVSLTGAGQMVGLLELDGYYSNDIVSYETLAKLPKVPLINVNVTNYAPTNVPGSGVVEVSLDIEMAIAMAPGLAAVVVFQAGQSTDVTGFDDILDSMASSNQIKQFSSSWGYTGSPDPNTTIDGWLQKMATQGQSFFQASGDGDAWVNPIWTPADSPYLTSVGGTSLTMNGYGASYSSETVWNEGNQGHGNAWSPNGNGYIGSGGGVSTIYSIPSWQQGAITSTNHGSSTMRNIPDVALTGDDIWVTYGNGQSGAVGGTSCAAPLWAGFAALANQQAASGGTSVGFINPAIYALGQGSSYASSFHDITTGNNTNAQSHKLYSAVAGFDLCTGWGTPNGSGLINALCPEPLLITPSAGFISSGPFGGPFSVTNQNFTLTNIDPAPLNWSLGSPSPWLAASSSAGTLTFGGAAAIVSVGLNSAASNLAVGAYTNTVTFTNLNDGVTQSRQFVLTVSQTAPLLSWSAPSPVTYGAALGSNQLNATANVPGSFAYNPSVGAVLNTGTNILSVIFTPTDKIDYSNATNAVAFVVLPASLTVIASNATRTYGQSNPAFTGTITGLQNGDNITATYSSSATSNSPVGTYPITPTLADPNNRLTNYTVNVSNGTLTITMATPLLSWITPPAITYGTVLDSNQLNATANVPGGFAYAPPAGTVLNTGTNILSGIFTPTDMVDYNSATDIVNLVVLPAPLAVTASNACQVYGQANPAFTGTITGLQNGDNITATFSSSATSNSPVGTYPVTPILVDPNNRLTNYIVSLTNGTLTITMATPLLSWITPPAITYGTALDSNQLNATANVPGSFVYNPLAGMILNTGTNILSGIFTPADMVDYNSATDIVNLVVLPAPLTVTASNAFQVYGQANPAFTGTITGLQNGDNITATYASSATSNSPVGTYPITPTLVDSNNRLTNYTVSVSNGTLTITMATPLLTWITPPAITYGTALDSNQLNATANVPGSFAYSPSAGTVASPGANTLSVLFTPADTVDYNSTTGNVSLVVLLVPIALNIQLVSNDVVLSWNDPASVFALQTAPDVTCVFTNVPGASSPYTNTNGGALQFFQLVAPGN
jgi:hypothetical protein